MDDKQKRAETFNTSEERLTLLEENSRLKLERALLVAMLARMKAVLVEIRASELRCGHPELAATVLDRFGEL